MLHKRTYLRVRIFRNDALAPLVTPWDTELDDGFSRKDCENTTVGLGGLIIGQHMHRGTTRGTEAPWGRAHKNSTAS